MSPISRKSYAIVEFESTFFLVWPPVNAPFHPKSSTDQWSGSQRNLF
jgi:hypothetical protein